MSKYAMLAFYLPQSFYTVTQLTWQDVIGDKLSISSTITKFLSGLGEKKNVVPSSSGLALLNLGSSSSSPRRAIWYKLLQENTNIFIQHNFLLPLKQDRARIPDTMVSNKVIQQLQQKYFADIVMYCTFKRFSTSVK